MKFLTSQDFRVTGNVFPFAHHCSKPVNIISKKGKLTNIILQSKCHIHKNYAIYIYLYKIISQDKFRKIMLNKHMIKVNL